MLEEFHNWAKEKGIGYILNYSECEDMFEVTTISAARAECFYKKRVSSLYDFMTLWQENLAIQIAKEASK